MHRDEGPLWINVMEQALQECAGHHLRHEFKLWSVDCSHPKLSDADVSVGLSWFNPLTDSNVILTLTPGFCMELRDHDGDGDDHTPHWYWDIISDEGYKPSNPAYDAYQQFFYYVRDQKTKYYKLLRTNRGGVTLFAKELLPILINHISVGIEVPPGSGKSKLAKGNS